MTNLTTIQYSTNGHTYEIRTALFGEWHVVQAFENGAPASYRYGVTTETASDMRRQNGDAAVEELIEVVKGDLQSRNG